MKSLFIVMAAAIAAAVASNSKGFEKCPNAAQNLPPPIKYNYKQMEGAWYVIREGPYGSYGDKAEKMDCFASFVYQEHESPADQMTILMRIRKNKDKYITKTKQVKLVPAGEDGLYENDHHGEEHITRLNGEGKVKVSYEAKLIETDDGNSYSIWAKCVEIDDKNATLVWAIKSRGITLDAKLEQTLVEKIEKYGGVAPSQLRGISHIGCH